MVKVLDLFSGLEGWSEPFKARGHETFTIDNNPNFGANLVKDIREVSPSDIPFKPDIILASPPCEKFSIMRISTNWNKDNTPKTAGAAEAVVIVQKTIDLIENINPDFWIMENPIGKLRSLGLLDNYTNHMITYCQYGTEYMKPTDLWGKFPPSFIPRPKCKNGDPCHLRAPRGAKVGVQENVRTKFRGGMIEDMSRLSSESPRRWNLTALRSKVPYQLALEVCLAVEKDLIERN